ncbi:MAG: hypothetical protein US76_01100 [Parcubacteria group bacterium GW2011_GWA2_38_13b]|nr:MAG: hypothetical protein US76_01100 [Parcubacteria group bacterium GW2011_GWA2_38_13b]
MRQLINQNATRGYGLLENFLAKLRINKVNTLIPPQARRGAILDIGCGIHPIFLLRINFYKKYGLDKSISKSGIQRFSNESLFVQNHNIEEQEIPFNGGFFDIVTMLAVFEHINPLKLKKITNEVYRVLKSNGLFIMTTPAPWSDKLLKLMAKVNLVSLEEIDEHQNIYSRKKISAILQEGRFQKKAIQSGYFEMGLNIWTTAKK